MDDGEAEAGAALLFADEGVEDAVAQGGVHSGALIADAEADEAIFLADVEGNVRGRRADLDGVAQQVGQGLHHLGGVCRNLGHVGVYGEIDDDILVAGEALDLSLRAD